MKKSVTFLLSTNSIVESSAVVSRVSASFEEVPSRALTSNTGKFKIDYFQKLKMHLGMSDIKSK